MDIRLIILIVVFVVLMVAFGNNPLQGPADTRPGDPFQRALQDKLDQTNAMQGGNSFGTGSAQPVQQQAPTQPQGALGMPPGSYGAQQPQIPSWNQAQPTQALPEAAFYLTDGRRVFFQGYKVFTLSPDGTLHPLPDGTYALKDGSPIIIQNGDRQAAPPAQ